MSAAEPISQKWDPEDDATFPLEDLDHRWEALLARMRAADSHSWVDIDSVVGALLCADLLPHAAEFVEILGGLVERQRERRSTALRDLLARTEAQITALSN